MNNASENMKNDLRLVQEKLIRSIQAISKITMSESVSENALDKKLNAVIDYLEEACITARCTVEKYRPDLPFAGGVKEMKTVPEVTGDIEVTAEGWIHITLHTLLPHCRYKSNPYIHDTLMRLISEYPFELPRFNNAFMAIVEYCNYNNRTVFDQDNKAWKAIPNALKGRAFEDDDRFRLNIGLFSKISPEISCHIYVLPIEQISDFTYYLSNDLL